MGFCAIMRAENGGGGRVKRLGTAFVAKYLGNFSHTLKCVASLVPAYKQT